MCVGGEELKPGKKHGGCVDVRPAQLHGYLAFEEVLIFHWRFPLNLWNSFSLLLFK